MQMFRALSSLPMKFISAPKKSPWRECRAWIISETGILERTEKRSRCPLNDDVDVVPQQHVERLGGEGRRVPERPGCARHGLQSEKSTDGSLCALVFQGYVGNT